MSADPLDLIDECGVVAVMHSERFRKVANRYPRRIAEAYGGGIAGAALASDDEVAATVAEWERQHGLRPRDWPVIGAAERDEPPAGAGRG